MKRGFAACILFSVLVSLRGAGYSSSFELPQPALLLQNLEESSPPPVISELVPLLPAAPVTAQEDDPLQGWSGRFDSAPDWELTPGVLCTVDDKDFEEFRYSERIPYCRRNLSVAEKKEVSRWYGVAWEDHSAYQYDHLLSLCLGGSNDLRNIWPMPYTDARAKAKLEWNLCRRLREGEVTQSQAIEEELSWFADNAPALLKKILPKAPRLAPLES